MSSAVFVAGAVALALIVVTWTVRDWAEGATGDPDANDEVRERMIAVLTVPLAAVGIAAVMVLSISRVLLTVERLDAVVVAGAAAGLIFLSALLIAYVPRLGPRIVTAFLLVGAVLVIGAGILSAVRGERDFEEHGPDQGGLISDRGVAPPGGTGEIGT